MNFTPKGKTIETLLGGALGTSIVRQVADHRRLDLESLPRDSPLLEALKDDLTELGINPYELASESLGFLVALFSQESNADLIVRQSTDLLWEILGDSKNGGRPPEIYRRAGVAMYLALLGILDPSLIEKRAHS